MAPNCLEGIEKPGGRRVRNISASVGKRVPSNQKIDEPLGARRVVERALSGQEVPTGRAGGVPACKLEEKMIYILPGVFGDLRAYPCWRSSYDRRSTVKDIVCHNGIASGGA